MVTVDRWAFGWGFSVAGKGLGAFGEGLRGASMSAGVHKDVLAFCMGTCRPNILPFIMGVLHLEGPLWSVGSLRVKHPTQLYLQTEEHMKHGRRKEERGRHCVFRYC